MTQPIVVRTKTFSARTVLRRNRNIVDILPWKTPFWKIKPKRSDFPRGKITPSGLTVGDCKLREKCQGHPKRESGHAGKARIALACAQDGHAAPYACGYQGGQTRQRPQSKQAHQRLPVCAAHPIFDSGQCEDGNDQRGQPSHWLVRADGAGDLFPEIVYAALFGGPLWDKEQLPNYHEDGLVSDG